MALEALDLDHVGPFEHVELTFPAGSDPDRADVHLLVGPNGCGKSTLLSAIGQLATPQDTGFSRRLRPGGWAAGAFASRWTGVGGSGPGLVFPGSKPRNGLGVHGRRSRESLTWWGADSWADGPLVIGAGALRNSSRSRVTGVVHQEDDARQLAPVLDRPEGLKPVAQWIVNTLAAQAMADRRGDPVASASRRAVIATLEAILSEITEKPVTLDTLDDWALAMRIDGGLVPIESLADGLQSILAFVGDVMMRLDRVPAASGQAPHLRPFVLLLDEVEVHLHPAWQRRVLPVVERAFPNAQIIAATHSPFVIGSAADAWVHRLRIDGDGRVTVDPPIRAPLGTSQSEILRDLMGVTSEFDVASEQWLTELDAALTREDRSAVDGLAARLTARGVELAEIAAYKIRTHRRARTVR